MSDDQIMLAFSLWVHWIMPILFVVMFLGGVMAIYQSLTKHVPPPPETGSPEKEEKGSCQTTSATTCPQSRTARTRKRSTRKTSREHR